MLVVAWPKEGRSHGNFIGCFHYVELSPWHHVTKYIGLLLLKLIFISVMSTSAQYHLLEHVAIYQAWGQIL